METEIEKINPNFKDEFNKLLCFDDFRYLYHVTNANGDNICSEGLFLAKERLDSTTIEIPLEFKENPIRYCLNEMGNNYRKNPNIILLGIPEDEIPYAVEKNYNNSSSWNSDEYPEYVINSKYIIGYINTSNFEIIINENYEYANEFIF